MALASALLQVMTDAVRKTARPMLRDFGEVSQLQQELKKSADQLETLQLHAMESDDQKQRAQQKLQQLTQLFEQQLSA